MTLQLFEPMSWPRFQLTYRPHIRTSIDWQGLVARPPKVGIEPIDCDFEEEDLYFPWYTHSKARDAWRDGKRQRVPHTKTRLALVRAPVACYDGQTILLDCCHRIQAHRPRFLILDVLELNDKNHRFITDFV